jgi:uncharacterized protein
MPAAAWPGTVHRYWNFPPFLNVTFTVAVVPGFSFLVTLPSILKSCSSAPLFVTLKVTTPFVADFFDSVNLSSDGLPAVTLTTVAFEAPKAAGSAIASAAPATAKIASNPLLVMLLLGWTCAYPDNYACLPGAARVRPVPLSRARRLSEMPRRSRHGGSSARTRVRRLPERGRYDREAIDAILDAGLVAHLGFVSDGQPFVIPTLHARVGDDVYVHGSSASRTLRTLSDGIAACLTVTLLDGIVLARSVFEHSMNYRSAVVLGTATTVVDREEKLSALEAFTEKLLPGRWEEARRPTPTELKATSVLRLPLDEASAKIRDGGPEDGNTPDAELDVWAGYLPLAVTALEPVPDAVLRPGIPLPQALSPYRRPGLVG